MRSARLPAALAALSVAASPVWAQDTGEDWDFGHDASRNLTIAAVTFDNFGIAVRCMNQTLSVMVSGVPVPPGVQTFDYAMGSSSRTDTRWVSAGRDGPVFALWPAHVARDLSAGGRLSLGIPDGERVRRLAVDLPASPSAIGQVLGACGRELATPIDDVPDRENMAGLQWRNRPEPSFPSRTDSDGGVAALICDVESSGALTGCQVESEFPEGGGFGRAAVLGAHRTGRVQLADGDTGDMAGRKVSFYVRYGMSLELPPVPTRIPSL